MATKKQLSKIERVLVDGINEYQHYSMPSNQVAIKITLEAERGLQPE